MLIDFIKTSPQFILPKKTLTHLAGLCANIKNKHVKNLLISQFIRHYQVGMSEALQEDPAMYACFNDFFIRSLKKEHRPIAQTCFVSPVDGVVSELGPINQGQVLQAKGRYYSVAELLTVDEPLLAPFDNGHFITMYLSPKDYHRVHMPIDGRLTQMIHMPGKLFSVQPVTARIVPKLFSRNERLICFFDTSIGTIAMVLVGATIVGSIGTVWQGDIQRQKKKQMITYEQEIHLKKGEEMGYFKLGSTVILLFPAQDQFQWADAIQREAKIKYGQALADCDS